MLMMLVLWVVLDERQLMFMMLVARQLGQLMLSAADAHDAHPMGSVGCKVAETHIAGHASLGT